MALKKGLYLSKGGENMAQDEAGYPHCIKCGEKIRYASGNLVSFRSYVNLKGICNDCDDKIQELEWEAKNNAKN